MIPYLAAMVILIAGGYALPPLFTKATDTGLSDKREGREATEASCTGVGLMPVRYTVGFV